MSQPDKSQGASPDATAPSVLDVLGKVAAAGLLGAALIYLLGAIVVAGFLYPHGVQLRSVCHLRYFVAGVSSLTLLALAATPVALVVAYGLKNTRLRSWRGVLVGVASLGCGVTLVVLGLRLPDPTAGVRHGLHYEIGWGQFVFPSFRFCLFLSGAGYLTGWLVAVLRWAASRFPVSVFRLWVPLGICLLWLHPFCWLYGRYFYIAMPPRWGGGMPAHVRLTVSEEVGVALRRRANAARGVTLRVGGESIRLPVIAVDKVDSIQGRPMYETSPFMLLDEDETTYFLLVPESFTENGEFRAECIRIAKSDVRSVTFLPKFGKGKVHWVKQVRPAWYER